MLGAAGILVGAVFVASIYVQTVLGFSALRGRVSPSSRSRSPSPSARWSGRLLLAHASPRAIATAGLVIAAGAAALLSVAGANATI